MTINYRDLQKALKEYNDELKDYTVELFGADSLRSYAELEADTWGNAPVEVKVNWCALGAVKPEDAEAMALLLSKAAEWAKNFKYNGYTVTF